MCGIYGHFARERANSALVEAMGACLKHRGPDGQSMYCEDRLAFGATRLAIIDLSAPPGVIFNEDRSVAVVFNGEIYNYRALRAELEQRGHRFATRTDTEVLVHGYEEWHIGLLDRLRGMFAFAIWDGAQLFLARDRLGEKPLYYAEWSGDFYFASELKALLRSPQAARRLDQQALLCYMTLGYAPPPLTLFEDIRKLGAGEYLLVTAQGMRKGRYWQARADSERRPMVYTRAVQHIRQALEEAVANCLISDVPVGVFLSGGLDSSIVTTLAVRQLGAQLHTFTVGYDFPAGSENDLKFNVDVRYAELLAKQLGTQHHVIRIAQARLAQLLPRLVYSADEPIGQPALIQVAHVAALARQYGVPVLLSGEASDELFFGYSYYRSDYRLAQYLKLPALLRRGLLDPLFERLPARFRALHNLARRAQLTDPIARCLTWTQLTSPEQYGGLLRDGQGDGALHQQSLAALLAPWRMAARAASFTARIAYVDLSLNMAESINLRLDRLSMALSIEARSPFQDHLLAELALSLPLSYKLGERRTKIVLRDAVRKLLPEAILRRPKWGFFPPISKWLRSALRPLVARFLAPENVAAVGIFKPEAVQEVVEAHYAQRRYEMWTIWSLLTFHIWHALFVSETLTAPERLTFSDFN
jgi:asparagine synthase (glutamine-hydrolysing)